MSLRLTLFFAFFVALTTQSFGASQIWNLVPGLGGGKARSGVITSAPNGDVYCAFNLRPVSGASFLQAVKLSPLGAVIWSVSLTDPVAAGFTPKEIASDGTHVVITGTATGPPNAKDEMFTVNLRASNGSLRWFHEENINTLPDEGQRVVIRGDSAFLAGSVGHAFTAIRVRLEDGLELWQRTFAAIDAGVNVSVDLALNPNGDVFVSATRGPTDQPNHIVLVKIDAGGQLINEVVAEPESIAHGLARLTNGRLAVCGETITTEGIRPVVNFFADSGADDNAVIYPDNAGQIFTDIVPGPDAGFACAIQAGSQITIARFDFIATFLAAEVPGPGTIPALEVDNFLNPIAALAVNPSSGSDFGRIFRAVEFDATTLSLTSTDVKPTDLFVSPFNSQWLVAMERKTSTSDSVEFRAFNPRPVAHTDLFDMFQGQTLSVAAPGVLGNDTGGPGATAVGVTIPATVVLQSNGAVTVTSAPAFNGIIDFVYKAVRGAFEASADGRVFVQPILQAITLPAEVRGGQSAVGQVVLTGNRLRNTLTLTVTENSNFTILLQPQISIAVGQSQGAFILNTAVPRTDQPVTVSATLAGATLTKVIIVKAPRVASITAVTPTVIGPAAATLRVTLDGPAPSNGIAVNLTDDSTFIATQSSVAVPANVTSVDYTSITAATTTTKVAIVTASLNGSTATATVNIVGYTFAISPNTKIGGQQGTGTLTLTSSAGAPILFDLTDDSTATAFNQPPTATIASGSATGTFQILTAAVVSTVTATITATGQGIARTATLTVQSAVLDSVAVNPTSLRGGVGFVGTVRLTGISVAGGSVVNLSDNSPNVTVPPSATISGGSASRTFNGTTTAVTASVMVVITASRGGVTKTVTLVVTP